jgi:hypothetical protein
MLNEPSSLEVEVSQYRGKTRSARHIENILHRNAGAGVADLQIDGDTARIH